MIKFYCGVPEECTEEMAQPLFSALLNRVNIKMVFMHCECCLSTTLEHSVSEVAEAERRNPEGSNFPLQPNCFYSYTPLEGSPSNSRHPIVKLLGEDRRKSNKAQARQFLNCSLPQEKDYKDLPFAVCKDIIFVDEITNKEVGWYNKAANIIWASDIFHFVDSSKNNIPIIVDAIVEYNRYGRLPEVLTIGADPEFEIEDDDGNFIEAHSLFGEHGCDPKTEIGYDGHSPTGELRPKPAKSPLALTRNIKRLVRRMNGMRSMANTQVLVGGGKHVTTGGHIHFGTKGVPNDLKDLLYDMVAEPVLAFQSERRKTNEGGNWRKDASGTLRDQPHGCEWRPLPSFIVNEEITAAVLSTSYAIVKSWKFHNYRKETRPITIADYHRIPLYGAYKKQIDTFVKFFVTKEAKAVLQGKDIFSEWKVDKIQKNYTVDIISQAPWLGDYFTPVNADIKKPVKLEIRFNGDTVVTFGIKDKFLVPLKEFADAHFLPELQVNEPLPKGQSRPIICLPGSWYHMTGKTKFCSDFKAVLKDVILALGGAR